MDAREIPNQQLIGDPNENFYQLGTREKESFKKLSYELRNIFTLASPIKNQLVGQWIKLKISSQFFTETFQSLASAYSEGLGISLDEIRYLMTLSEMACAPGEFLPSQLKIPGLNLGCSSVFYQSDDSTYMLRVLDYPLNQHYSHHQSLISLQLKNFPKLFYPALQGFPFPGTTVQNEAGLCLSLHQKFSSQFYWDGESIFSIIFDLMTKADSFTSALKILGNKKSCCKWGLNLLNPAGEILTIDIHGEILHKKNYILKNRETLVLTNQSLKPDAKPLYFPPGLNQYNESRYQSAMKLFKDIKKPEDFLSQLITMPYRSSKSLKDQLSFQYTPYTFSTVQASVLISNKSEHYLLTDLVSAQPVVLKIEKLFEIMNKKSLLNLKSLSQNQIHYLTYYQTFARIQSAFDHNQLTVAGDLLQKVIRGPFADLKLLAQFYYDLLQFKILESHQDLRHLYQEMRVYLHQLPSPLDNHHKLLLALIELSLGEKPQYLSFNEEDFQVEAIRYHYARYKKLKPWAIKQMKKLILPRIDLMDVYY